jgi:hypothetical protein
MRECLTIDGVSLDGEKKKRVLHQAPRKQSNSVLQRTWKSSLRKATPTPAKHPQARGKTPQRNPRRDPDSKSEAAPEKEPQAEHPKAKAGLAEQKCEPQRPGGFFKFTDTDAKGVNALTGVQVDENYEEEDFEEESHFEEELVDQLEQALARKDSAPIEGLQSDEDDEDDEDDDFEDYEEEVLMEMRDKAEMTAGIEEDIVEGYGTTPLWKTSNKALQFKFTDTDVKRTRTHKLAQQ